MLVLYVGELEAQLVWGGHWHWTQKFATAVPMVRWRLTVENYTKESAVAGGGAERTHRPYYWSLYIIGHGGASAESHVVVHARHVLSS